MGKKPIEERVFVTFYDYIVSQKVIQYCDSVPDYDTKESQLKHIPEITEKVMQDLLKDKIIEIYQLVGGRIFRFFKLKDLIDHEVSKVMRNKFGVE